MEVTKLHKYFRAIAVAALAVTALTFSSAGPAAAGGSGVFSPSPVYDNHTQPEFEYEVYGMECEDLSFVLLGQDGNEVDAEFRGDQSTGTILVGADVPGGEYVAEATCDGEAFDFEIAFGRSVITKNVVGDAPSDASFVVNVACESEIDFDIDLTFPASGGTKSAVNYDSADCTVTEPDDGGAESVDIDNPNYTFEEPADLPATVTNTFAEAEQPDPSETPRGEEPLGESTPAAPVTAKPALTG